MGVGSTIPVDVLVRLYAEQVGRSVGDLAIENSNKVSAASKREADAHIAADNDIIKSDDKVIASAKRRVEQQEKLAKQIAKQTGLPSEKKFTDTTTKGVKAVASETPALLDKQTNLTKQVHNATKALNGTVPKAKAILAQFEEPINAATGNVEYTTTKEPVGTLKSTTAEKIGAQLAKQTGLPTKAQTAINKKASVAGGQLSNFVDKIKTRISGVAGSIKTEVPKGTVTHKGKGVREEFLKSADASDFDATTPKSTTATKIGESVSSLQSKANTATDRAIVKADKASAKLAKAEEQLLEKRDAAIQLGSQHVFPKVASFGQMVASGIEKGYMPEATDTGLTSPEIIANRGKQRQYNQSVGGPLNRIPFKGQEGKSPVGASIAPKGMPFFSKLQYQFAALNKRAMPLTKSFRNLNYSLIGVMFGAMAINKVFSGMLSPIMDAMGVGELINAMLMMALLPAGLKILDLVLQLFDTFSSLDPRLQSFLGYLIVAGFVISGVVMVLAQFGLLISSIIFICSSVLGPLAALVLGLFGLSVAEVAAALPLIGIVAAISAFIIGMWLLIKIILWAAEASGIFDLIGEKLDSLFNTIAKWLGLGIATPVATGVGQAKPSLAMAVGGIVNKPTNALIGEKGPEAVVPLSEFSFGNMDAYMAKQNELSRQSYELSKTLTKGMMLMSGLGIGGLIAGAIYKGFKKIKEMTLDTLNTDELKVSEEASKGISALNEAFGINTLIDSIVSSLKPESDAMAASIQSVVDQIKAGIEGAKSGDGKDGKDDDKDDDNKAVSSIKTGTQDFSFEIAIFGEGGFAGWWKRNITPIKEGLSTAIFGEGGYTQWKKDHIDPLSKMFDGITFTSIKAAISTAIFGEGGWTQWKKDNPDSIITSLSTMFDGITLTSIVGKLSTAVFGEGGWTQWKKDNIDPLVNALTNVFNDINLGSISKSIGNVFRKLKADMDKVNTGAWTMFNAASLGTLEGLTELASGGIVTKPTLALLGEKGPEAVTPLSGSSNYSSSPIINIYANVASNVDIQHLANEISAQGISDLRRLALK